MVDKNEFLMTKMTLKSLGWFTILSINF